MAEAERLRASVTPVLEGAKMNFLVVERIARRRTCMSPGTKAEMEVRILPGMCQATPIEPPVQRKPGVHH
jgi:hypothetical protein